MRAQLTLAEHFLNWYPHHTKLYIRGQRGKDWATQRALDKELADALHVFFERYTGSAYPSPHSPDKEGGE